MKTTIAELIGETPEMMIACGLVIKAEFDLAATLEFPAELQERKYVGALISDCRKALEIGRNLVADLMMGR